MNIWHLLGYAWVEMYLGNGGETWRHIDGMVPLTICKKGDACDVLECGEMD